MTWFGIYLLVYWLLNIAVSFYYLGKGDLVYTRLALTIGIVWTGLNILGLLTVGTGAL